MLNGKKRTVEHIIYDALQLLAQQTSKDPVAALEQAVKNATPLLEVKPRRVGGATYQVPIDIRPQRRVAMAFRWIISFAQKRGEQTMREKLAAELMDAANNTGTSMKKKEDTHRMADANKAFAHYRW